MKRQETKIVLAALAMSLGITACGITDGGEGSNTLYVESHLTYKAETNRSEVTVIVKNKTGNFVKDADVGLETEDGKVIRIPSDLYSSGYYRETIKGYENVLRLIVKNGESNHLEATLEGPGKHVITSPYNDFVLDSHKEPNLLAKWKNEEDGEVDAVSIKTALYNEEYNGNMKSVRLNINRLKRGREHFEVSRNNSVDLDGGLPGSKFTMEYIASNNFTVD